MQELSMHVLDIAQNSIAAKATLLEISIIIDEANNTLVFIIKDNGKGMDETTLEAIKSPFYTSRTTRKIGLGVPMLIETAEMTNGHVDISSQKGVGTTINAVFGLYHVDRPPMGDLAGTILILLLADELIDIAFRYEKVNGEKFSLDTREIKMALDGMPISEPSVISFIKDYLANGIELVNNGGVL